MIMVSYLFVHFQNAMSQSTAEWAHVARQQAAGRVCGWPWPLRLDLGGDGTRARAGVGCIWALELSFLGAGPARGLRILPSALVPFS